MRALVYRLYAAAIVLVLALGSGYAVAVHVLTPAARDAQARLGLSAWLTLWAGLLVTVLAGVCGRALPLWATSAELIWGDLVGLLRVRSRARLALWGLAVITPLGLVLVAAEASAAADAGAWLLVTAVVAVIVSGAMAVLPHLDRAGWADLVRAAAAWTGVALLSWSTGTLVMGVFLVVTAGILLGARDGLPRRPDGPRRWYAVPPRWELARAGRAIQAWHRSVVMFDGGP